MKLPGYESYVDRDEKAPETLFLNNLHITSLRGLENIDMEDKEILDLAKNKITSLDYLVNINNDTINTILLNNNNIEQITAEDLFLLQARFPELQCLNLRDNPLSSEHRKEIRGWHQLLGLSYSIKLYTKKHAEH